FTQLSLDYNVRRIMYRHVAFIRFKDELSEEKRQHWLDEFNKLQSLIPTIRSASAGLNIVAGASGGYHLCLVVDFDDEQGYREYQVHPEHMKLVNLYKEFKEQISVIDYLPES